MPVHAGKASAEREGLICSQRCGFSVSAEELQQQEDRACHDEQHSEQSPECEGRLICSAAAASGELVFIVCTCHCMLADTCH